MVLRTVAILSPGDMGEGVGASIKGQGIDVITVLAGRSNETRMRAERAGFREVADLEALVAEADLVLSIIPPERAEATAADVAAAMKRACANPPFADMNAIAPTTANRIAGLLADVGAVFIDGGIIGWPPFKGENQTKLYVSGPDAVLMDELDGNGKIIIQIGEEIGRASAVKMVYASVTKGTDSLLTAAYTAAEALGVREILEAEWEKSQPDALVRMGRRVPVLPADAGRWIGEMEQIAETYASVGVTPNYHRGAADMYRLLDSTPFGRESRETIDKTRTMQDSVKVYVRYLNAD
ncbi:MAG: NAD(P)-dependent oxidoreductase [Rhodospirillaceae bacterium]|nr:MAG: NAD(P)-dependent oxidoreductase [Rhodospirillaceae bacterium]